MSWHENQDSSSGRAPGQVRIFLLRSDNVSFLDVKKITSLKKLFSTANESFVILFPLHFVPQLLVLHLIFTLILFTFLKCVPKINFVYKLQILLLLSILLTWVSLLSYSFITKINLQDDLFAQSSPDSGTDVAFGIKGLECSTNSTPHSQHSKL